MRATEYRLTVYVNDFQAIVVNEKTQTYFITVNQLDREKIRNMPAYFIFERELEQVQKRLIDEGFSEEKQMLKGRYDWGLGY